MVLQVNPMFSKGRVPPAPVTFSITAGDGDAVIPGAVGYLDASNSFGTIDPDPTSFDGAELFTAYTSDTGEGIAVVFATPSKFVSRLGSKVTIDGTTYDLFSNTPDSYFAKPVPEFVIGSTYEITLE